MKKRIHAALPIRITYWDNETKPVLEMACTYDISERGARVTGLRSVKQTGEILAVERGRNKSFCRVVWIGEPNSELQGQIGIECVESDGTLWDNELQDMEEAYDPILTDGGLKKAGAFASHERRRRRERYALEGGAELIKQGSKTSFTVKAALLNMSEIGCRVSTKDALLPGTDLKLVLNIGDYEMALKGRVRHADEHGVGIEFHEIRKGERQILQFLIRKLAEKHLEDSLQFEIHR